MRQFIINGIATESENFSDRQYKKALEQAIYYWLREFEQWKKDRDFAMMAACLSDASDMGKMLDLLVNQSREEADGFFDDLDTLPRDVFIQELENVVNKGIEDENKA